MKLLTEELLAEFRKQGDTGGMHTDNIKIIAKYFYPRSVSTWYATEFLEEEELFFGYVSLYNDPSCDELGYFALCELEEYEDKLGIGIERDLYFGEHFLTEVLNGGRP